MKMFSLNVPKNQKSISLNVDGSIFVVSVNKFNGITKVTARNKYGDHYKVTAEAKNPQYLVMRYEQLELFIGFYEDGGWSLTVSHIEDPFWG